LRRCPSDELLALSERILEGTEAHHPPAALELGRVIAQENAKARCPSCLVISGDQSTFGDTSSIQRARMYLDPAIQSSDRVIEIHGNHDAWPSTAPLFGPRSFAATVKSSLINLNYRVEAPGVVPPFLSISGGPRVEVFTVDTVDMGRWENTRALGRVDDKQLDELERIIADNDIVHHNSPVLRVLIAHHPIGYPPPVPSSTMVIANGGRVGFRLRRSPKQPKPLVHLVLSGHTHDPFPKQGSLPASAQQYSHHPLGYGQVQLVAGTATQRDAFNKYAVPYRFQILRMYRSTPHSASRVVVERTIMSRGKIGAYRADPAEKMVVDI
jgi:3',5'-cyclic AMP phosphodiesterase CpdA